MGPLDSIDLELCCYWHTFGAVVESFIDSELQQDTYDSISQECYLALQDYLVTLLIRADTHLAELQSRHPRWQSQIRQTSYPGRPVIDIKLEANDIAVSLIQVFIADHDTN
jgi:hypothetical protein